MAVDKLIDSSKLDACCTAEANAIRAKTGDSSAITYDWSNSKGFADAIAAISGGGSSAFTFGADTIRQLAFWKGEESEIYVDYTKFPQTNTLNSAFNGDWNKVGWTKIAIKPPTTVMDTRNMFYCSSSSGDTALKQIDIDGTLLLSITSNNSFIGGRKGLERVSGLLDLTGVTNDNFYAHTGYANGFYNCNALETVGFVAGSMARTTANWYMSWCPLSDASVISLANALKDTYSGTITLNATPKARLSSIMGTVATSDNLSIFTASASGTVSLQDFLTQTKGATIA